MEQIQERDFMYEVIHFFTDLQDFEHPYNVGDKFPRDGLTVSEERLKELSGSNNKQHKPLIKFLEEEIPFSDNGIELEGNSSVKKYTKTEINRMSTAELQNLAAVEGIENAFETSGNELKKILAEHFGL